MSGLRILVMSLLVSCTTTPKESSEVDINAIDPNAPAQPADSVASEAPSDTTPTNTPPAPAPETPAPEVAVTPETPKVEELVPAESGETIGTLDDGPTPAPGAEKSQVVSEPPGQVNEPADVKSPRVLGSGKQKRYIKAAQLHIRSRPDRFSKSLGLVYGGDEVHVTIRGDWAKLEEGQWIRSRWLVKARPKASGGTSEKVTRKKVKRSKTKKKKRTP